MILLINDLICRRRSTDIAVHQEYFARLPGYPSENSNGGIDLAIYCKIPGVGVLSSNDLLAVMVSSVANIQNDIGMIYLSLVMLIYS